jgi:hypothetical protein
MATPDVNLRTGAINTGKVIAAKIAALAVETAKLAANAVTEAKIEVGSATAGLTGLVVKFLANANVIGALPVLHRIDVADTAGNYDITLTHKSLILDAWALNTGAAAHATDDTWQLKNSTNAISDAVAKTATVNAIKSVSTLNPTYATVDAGGTLRVTAVKDTNCACTVFVLAARVS